MLYFLNRRLPLEKISACPFSSARKAELIILLGAIYFADNDNDSVPSVVILVFLVLSMNFDDLATKWLP